MSERLFTRSKALEKWNKFARAIWFGRSTKPLKPPPPPPFYTKEGWKDAADLTKQYHIQTKNKKWYCVKGQNFLYTKKKVYNFEVEDWHTYFVGKLAYPVKTAKSAGRYLKG
ncbi:MULTISPECIES: polymorphic toxin-type HINT domain-containing protein [unclassified Gilliamella]|uniref:polymorphic toxin-type HINT domain-containing protein n=1 Tax=unclassified Gilliamella TaxID=2685620 RepID=UPI002269FB7D|nr:MULTISPECIES: polymorphic toxin-type HINT domain-containing protein [unclassified Gilliamella]MCX8583884.1 hypothetical protein [Gilliamella sp. B3372]MCX8594551.1 hypothetical protein [Gilliamella sp. B3367]